MLNFKTEFEGFKKKEIADELEHISMLIRQGYPSGDGWSMEGNEEKEPVIEADEIDSFAE